MKRKIRERSAGCKSSGAPTDRIEHNGTARNKRRANGLAAIGLAGILAAGMGLTGCQNYESSSEMKARIQSAMPDSLGELTARLGSYRKTVKDLFPDSPQVRSALFYELAEEGLSHNGCLTREQAQIIINRKLEQEHE